MNLAMATNWIGTFKHYSQVPNADDGTTSFTLEISAAKTKGELTVVFSDRSQSQSRYESMATENAKGELDVRFRKDLLGNLGPVYKKDRLVFVLAPASDGVIMTFALDGKVRADAKKYAFARAAKKVASDD